MGQSQATVLVKGPSIRGPLARTLPGSFKPGMAHCSFSANHDDNSGKAMEERWKQPKAQLLLKVFEGTENGGPMFEFRECERHVVLCLQTDGRARV